MNRSLFDFNQSSWLPPLDKTVLEYCRNIRREEMEIEMKTVTGYGSYPIPPVL